MSVDPLLGGGVDAARAGGVPVMREDVDFRIAS